MRAAHVLCVVAPSASLRRIPTKQVVLLLRFKGKEVPAPFEFDQFAQLIRVRCAAIAGGVLLLVDEEMKRDSQAGPSMTPSTPASLKL